MPHYEFPRPMATVDVILFTVVDDAGVKSLKVVVTPRRSPPRKGALGLPGTFIHPDEDKTLLDAANRVLRDKCGLHGLFVEQLSTHGDARRDPRGWCVTTVYYALVAPDVLDKASEAIELIDARGAAGLPFDHDSLIAEGVARIAGKATYTTLPALLVPQRFMMTDLEEAYEAVLGRELDRNFFRRKMDELTFTENGLERPFLVRTNEKSRPAKGGRHAFLYEKATDRLITFPQRF